MPNQDELAAYFHSLSDEELTRRCAPGGLTEEAMPLAQAEMRSRGLPLSACTPAPDEPDGAPTAEPAYMGDYETVAKYLEPTEARLLQALLERGGIPAIVTDAHIVETHMLLAAATSGARVRVPAAYVGEAREMMARFANGDFEAAADEDDAGGDELPVEPEDERGYKTYRIYQRASGGTPIVVKVGFSWGALFFNPWWFLVNGMRMNFLLAAVILYGAVAIFLFPMNAQFGNDLLFRGMAILYLNVWILLARFGNALLSSHLEDEGYRLLATVKARNAAYARGKAVEMAAG